MGSIFRKLQAKVVIRMEKLINLLNGYKTYIGAGVIFVAGGLHELCNVTFVSVCISDNLYRNLLSIGSAIAVIGIGHKLTKIQKDL